MRQGDLVSLWDHVRAAGDLSRRFLSAPDAIITLNDLVGGSCVNGRVEELRGRSLLIATKEQLPTALALLELDGIARRLVLWPAELPIEQMPSVVASVPVDAIVSDGSALGAGPPAIAPHFTCRASIVHTERDHLALCRTEWIFLTSGTTGRPKLVVHTLSTLCDAIQNGAACGAPLVWSTFYDIRRYGGVQIFLRAMLSGGSIVLSSAQESTADFLRRAGAHRVSHISGTPSHWRRALMSPYAHEIAPQDVRLSGEIADQTILDNLQSLYPQARVTHAFASTEAGLAFEVQDGLEGFPASWIKRTSAYVEMKVENGSLRIRSSRTAAGYVGGDSSTFAGADGFVDTGDLVELRGDRYYFVGRRDGVINVGGLKVHPEEIEGVINRHPRVRMSLVRARKSPLVGALVVADVVLEMSPDSAAGQDRGLKSEILELCREALPRHKVPTAIKFVNRLAVAASGKVARHYA
jgi:acyl-CoA synthetase (AMP-forming)/AMP-acid ligase II